jgi:hypothetical protein
MPVVLEGQVDQRLDEQADQVQVADQPERHRDRLTKAHPRRRGQADR